MLFCVILPALLASSWCVAVAPAPQLEPRATGTCSFTEIQPAPTPSLCAIQGRIPPSALAVLAYTRASRREQFHGHGFDLCESACFNFFSDCNSFSYDPQTSRCGIYFKSLADQQFIVSNDTAGTLYYDRGCFRTNQYCSTRPFQTKLQPTTTCTLTYQPGKASRSGSQCFRADIALKTSMPIAQPTHPSQCAFACLLNSRCRSFEYESNDISEINCHLFGESLEEQGIVTYTATTSPLQTYFDRICYSTICRDCYRVTPTTTYHPPATNTPTCKPNAVPQIVQNPSFEDNASGAPWHLGENVTLIRNKPLNASDGLNFIQFTLAKGAKKGAYLNQTLTGLTPGRMYRLRFSVQNTGQVEIEFSVRLNNVMFYTGVQLVDYEKQNPYIKNYATFTAKSATADLSFELNPFYTIDGVSQISLDNVEAIPALPTKACTFRLQLSSSVAQLNGSFVCLNCGQYPGPLLTADYSAAQLFGVTGFNELVDLNSTTGQLATPHHPFRDLGDPGFSQLLEFAPSTGRYPALIMCTVTPTGELSCVDKKLNQRAFRYCNTCSDFVDEGDAAFALVNAQNPALFECPLVTLHTLPI